MSPSYYTLAPITGMESGNFGNTRLYYSEACDQSFVQVLTQAVDAHTFGAGILTRVRVSGCNRPPESHFAKIKARGANIVPVAHFDHVWQCQSTCVIYSGGRPMSYALEGFGTSHDQALDEVACGGMTTGLACEEIEVRPPAQ